MPRNRAETGQGCVDLRVALDEAKNARAAGRWDHMDKWLEATGKLSLISQAERILSAL